MSKYIDVDKTIRQFEELHGEENALLNCYNADWIVSFLEAQPEADAAEVARCKDCKWWTKCDDSPQGHCMLMQMSPTGGWFCANGRRE